jgi:thioredoxin
MKNRETLVALLLLFALPACANTDNQVTATGQTTSTVSPKKSPTMKATINLTEQEFLSKVVNYKENPEEWAYLGDKPCLIDFYADWCGPCKAIAPILEDIATEYAGQIYVYKVNTEKEQNLAAAFGIRSIPSLLIVPMKKQPQMAQGALPKETLRKAIQEVLLAE